MKRDPRYGTEHDRQRRVIQSHMNRGGIYRCSCERIDCNHIGQCPTLLSLGSRWDLGHADAGLGYNGPECIPCNRAAGARASRGANPTVVPDRW